MVRIESHRERPPVLMSPAMYPDARSKSSMIRNSHNHFNELPMSRPSLFKSVNYGRFLPICVCTAASDQKIRSDSEYLLIYYEPHVGIMVKS